MSQALDLLRDLIRCKSVTPANDGALEILQDFLTPLGFECQIVTFDGDGSYPVNNLFATRNRGGRHLLFAGHTDVVPVGDEAAWTHDPFGAEEVDGVMWGRGAVDMKSGVAAFCAALPELVDSGEADNGTISLLITGDEESDAVNGTVKTLQWAKEQGHQFDFGLVGEPSSAEEFGDVVKIGRRGSLSFTITVAGEQGHVAYPHKANNPIPVLSKIAAQLSSEPLDEGNENFQATNLELVTIDVGNSASNVIPASGRMSGNIRFNDLWDAFKLEYWLGQQILKVPANGCDIELKIHHPVSRSFVSNESKDVDLLIETVKKHANITPERSTGGGTSDARFIADYCPVAEFGLVGKSMHQVDEHVPTAMVDRLQAVYTDYVRAFLDQKS
ncbi:succinyl-diaminopimelate desuccinylase [Maritalea myrionectae]|uniref:Succinyl-diaminopimelate desuccinylase n=1 Tax=Maritalea myrionectae TaxID=454601 RepID=A0A2R4MHS8_9HYPH|nr:succinyl-diaminopimelate desuccinylase [Maritalea myrionectae]AVX05588.1 succinyl-diaminopimelate desuccinylase [Maritalea myrionectae]